jgi:hypothetical protein
VKLFNHAKRGTENPLDLCCSDFRLIVQHEATHGIPIPRPPVPVKAREGRPGESETMKQLNKIQREKAAALTAKFYEDHPFVGVPGEFVAYKMSRTHVPNPKQYVGLVVQKLFNDNNFYKGKISEYDDRRQWWHVLYDDDDDEEGWSVPNMKSMSRRSNAAEQSTG